MNRNSIDILQQLLAPDDRLWRQVVTLRAFQLLHRGKCFQASLPAGLAIDRAMLDDRLMQTACEAGATVLMPAVAKVHEVNPESCEVLVKRSSEKIELTTATVIMACGLGHRNVCPFPALAPKVSASSRVGIESIIADYWSDFETHSLMMIVGRRGYVGVAPICDRRLHVAAAVERKALQTEGPAKLVNEIITEANGGKSGWSDDIADALHQLPRMLDENNLQWRGTPPLTARAKRVSSQRIFLVGDAAGYVEPFTGEGIRWALQSGGGVAEFVARAAIGWNPSIARDWEVWYRTHVRREQLLCRQLSWGLKHAPARWIAHQLLRARPSVAQSMISRLNAKAQV